MDWNGTWPDYVQSYLWSLYFYENCGGLPAVQTLVEQPANSLAGYEAVLDSLGCSEDVDDLFGNWIVANFLDDTLVAQGQFGYRGIQLPPFSTSAEYSSYPVTAASGTVNHWAADYCLFTGFGQQNGIVLSFDGSDSSEYRVWGIAIRADGVTEVNQMPLNGETQSGSMWIGGLDDSQDQVILAVGDVSNSGGNSYSYGAEVEAGVSEQSSDSSRLSLRTGTNPFRENLALQLAWDADETVEAPLVRIFDLRGRLLRTITVSNGIDGMAELVWNGRNDVGTACPSGIYLIKASFGGETSEVSAILLGD